MERFEFDSSSIESPKLLESLSHMSKLRRLHLNCVIDDISLITKIIDRTPVLGLLEIHTLFCDYDFNFFECLTRHQYLEHLALTLKDLTTRIVSGILHVDVGIPSISLTVNCISEYNIGYFVEACLSNRSLTHITLRPLCFRPERLLKSFDLIDSLSKNQILSTVFIQVDPASFREEEDRLDFQRAVPRMERFQIGAVSIIEPRMDIKETLKVLMVVCRVFTSYSPRRLPIEIVEEIIKQKTSRETFWHDEHINTIIYCLLDRRSIGKIHCEFVKASRSLFYVRCRDFLKRL